MTDPDKILVVSTICASDLLQRYLTEQGFGVHTVSTRRLDKLSARAHRCWCSTSCSRARTACRSAGGCAAGRTRSPASCCREGRDVDRIVGLEMGPTTTANFNRASWSRASRGVSARAAAPPPLGPQSNRKVSSGHDDQPPNATLERDGSRCRSPRGESPWPQGAVTNPRTPSVARQIDGARPRPRIRVFDRSIDVQVSRLRNSSKGSRESSLLQTVWGSPTSSFPTAASNELWPRCPVRTLSCSPSS